ncbi:exonuclease family protein [Histomonas meleagridis]|uniref:exonuclease family protein n=1 Tax=Histomonas meleagridis TaxID=135588 RepID=UPI00355990F8|nr:exonuclease family protein [Histomonas meleagridis]KAH0802837.1 exonuclease family protein [Histomonas meleagridis]
MCLSLEERYDNGYPIKPGCQPNLNRTLRCSYFGMAVLTNEELALFDTLPDETEGALPVIGIDCEMIKTTCGEELARISCVDENGEIVIDEYFQPVGEVIDYRTQFSGISKETLQSVTLKSTDLLSILSKKADSHTIIIGHSLENDLRAMKIIHDKVIDTALVYNSDTKYPTKPGLAKLYQKYIKKPFRESGEGHDSAEDARAALELAKNALNYAVHEIKVDAKLPQLFTDLLPSVAAINVFAPAFACPYENIEPKVHCTVKDTNAEIAVELINSIENDPPRLTYSYFYSLSRCELTEESEKEAAAEYNRILGNVLERLPSYSVLMVYTANGNLKRLRNNEGKPMSFDDPAFVAEFALCKQGLLWVYSKTK